MKQDVESILKQSIRIAPLPVIFNRINAAVEDPECSFAQIARIISVDAALSARILKLANSSLFGFPSQIETITHAVTVIGMAQIRDLVLATTVTDHFRKMPRDLIDMKSFWIHSIACGLASRIIATYRHESNVERYYVLGMFHDLGRLVLYLNFPEQAVEAQSQARSQEKLLFKLEQDVIGCDHAELGGALLKKWQLPESLREPVLFHHAPSQAVHFPVEAAILHAGDLIVHALGLGFSGDPFVPTLDPRAWEKVDLPSSLLPAIVGQMDRQLPEAVQMFSPAN